MTFFLNEYDPTKAKPRRGPDMAPTGFLEGVGAAASREMRDSNANFLRQRERIAETDTTAADAARRLGMDKVRPILEERNEKARAAGLNSQIIDIPDDPAEALALIGPNGSKRVLELAREEAAANPDAWQDVDLSEEGIDKRLTERRIAEDRDDAMMRAMMPSGGFAADLIGGMAGATADVRNLPFLAMGLGGGSILRVMGREAALNMAAEGMTLPSRFETAEELGKPDPNVTETLAVAALAGAAFGGLFEGAARLFGAARGAMYYRDRQAIPEVDGVHPAFTQAAIEAAEDAIIAGENPIKAAGDIMRSAPRQQAAREPLIPDEPSPIAETPEATPLAPDPVTTDVLPPIEGEAPRTIGEVIATAQDGINKSRPNKPFLRSLRSSGGIDPNGAIGLELKGMGINARTYPGLFKKGGLKDVDNLPATEWDDRIPGISQAVGIADDGLYLNRQGVINAIADEVAGKRLPTFAELSARSEEYRPRTTEIEDFRAQTRADDGFFVEPDPFDDVSGSTYDTRKTAIGGQLNDYLFAKGIRDLAPGDHAEILDTLVTRGGDAKFLIERAIYREIDEIKGALEGPGNVAGRSAEGEGAGGQRTPEQPEPGNGTADPAGGRVGEPQGASERTAAGDQLLIPGVEAVSQRQRLEAQQGRAMRGGDKPMDGGLFDMNARAQIDMFSEPTDAKARPAQDAMKADLQDFISGQPSRPPAPLKATAGWKLHLNVDGPLADQVSAYLATKGINNKIGKSGGQDGKGMTVYVGAKDAANQLAKELDQQFGGRLGPPGADVLIDDIAFAGNVWGRFDAAGDAEFHQYGSAGAPYLLDDMSQIGFAQDRAAFGQQARARADKLLRERYGDFYTGGGKPQSNDFMVDMNDGKGARPASTLLRELDEDDEFMAILDLCGKPRGAQ